VLALAPGAAAQSQAQGAQAPQASVEMTPPDVLVKTVTLEVVDIIQKDKEIQKGDRRDDRAHRNQGAAALHFLAMTSSAVGRNWDKASAEQKLRVQENSRRCWCAPIPALSRPTAPRNSISGRCAPSRPTPTSP